MARTSAKRRSRMTHQFDRTAQATIPRSSFDRSFSLKTAFNSGYLIPVYLDEVYPGDTHTVRASLFGRLATLQRPILDSLFLETFFFFVPNRLVWDNWAHFMGEKDNPGDTTTYSVPVVSSVTSVEEGSLGDYFGLPVGVQYAQINANALPFRGVNLIYNEWFRDQNLQDSITVQKDDGPDNPSTNEYRTPQRRGKRHDYFTSCLPWPQKGDPVTVPLGSLAPVIPDVSNLPGSNNPTFTADDFSGSLRAEAGTGDILTAVGTPTNTTALSWNTSGLVADLANATGFTINQLRESFQIQKLLERDARGGTRLTEVIRSHFGVTSPDMRMQRPEFLGGGSTVMNTTPIPKTTTEGTSPQGDLAAISTVAAKGHGFTKSFTEHGFIIGLVNVRADLIYQQGMRRFWSRQTRFDYYWPALSHLGEMAVLSKEIFTDGSATDEDVFGYQEAWADLRYQPSLTTGAMRSAAAQTLDPWHLGQDFATRPVLSATFIEDNPPVQRVVAVASQGEPEILLDAYFKVRSVRPLPMYGTPGLIDHF